MSVLKQISLDINRFLAEQDPITGANIQTWKAYNILRKIEKIRLIALTIRTVKIDPSVCGKHG